MGLFLTLGLGVSLTGGWAFGAIAEDVIARNELFLIDRPTLRFLAEHRDKSLTTLMQWLSFLGSTPFVVATLGIVAVVVYARTRTRRWPLFIVTTVVGAVAIDNVVKLLVNRPRPHFHPLSHDLGSSFPSGHAVAAAALCGCIAYVMARKRSWSSGVWIWSSAVFLSGLIAFSRVYLGAHWPTDALGGLVLGGTWTAISATATGAFPERDSGGEEQKRVLESPP